MLLIITSPLITLLIIIFPITQNCCFPFWGGGWVGGWEGPSHFPESISGRFLRCQASRNTHLKTKQKTKQKRNKKRKFKLSFVLIPQRWRFAFRPEVDCIRCMHQGPPLKVSVRFCQTKSQSVLVFLFSVEWSSSSGRSASSLNHVSNNHASYNTVFFLFRFAFL